LNLDTVHSTKNTLHFLIHAMCTFTNTDWLVLLIYNIDLKLHEQNIISIINGSGSQSRKKRKRWAAIGQDLVWGQANGYSEWYLVSNLEIPWSHRSYCAASKSQL